MVSIVSKKLHFDEELKKKIEFICDFTNTKPIIINGSLRMIDKTNLTYLEPHRIMINDITFLAFNHVKNSPVDYFLPDIIPRCSSS